MKYEGYAEVSAERVLLACKRFKERRAKRIAEEREACVQALMNRRWFRPATRGDAVKRLKDDIFSGYGMAEVRGGMDACIVEEVEALASVSKTVLLSSRAAHILGSDLAS